MNESEVLLENWCIKKGWLFERIPEEATKTPDYELNIMGTKIYAEVKEIIANPEERQIDRQLSQRGWSDAYGEEPGKTVREKIKSGYPQIRKLAEQVGCCGILVLYNNSGVLGLGRLDHYHVLTGMFGLQTVPVTVSREPETPTKYELDYLGSKKSVTNDRNRYLSGILTLYEHHEKGLMAFFYHNPHAMYPVEPKVIDVENCIQYKPSSTEINWELVTIEKG
jgi:hypothetical protein